MPGRSALPGSGTGVEGGRRGGGGGRQFDGTFGYGSITAPGNDPYAITVGAMKIEGTTLRVNDLIASYSSKGPTLFDLIVKPDIVAPGNLTISTMAGSTLQNEFGNTNRLNGDFFILSGTQHGHSRSQRSGGAAASRGSSPDPRSGKGPIDAQRHQDVPHQQRCRRSDNRNQLHRLLRHFHGRVGLSRHPRSAQ
jgi:Subtilase family